MPTRTKLSFIFKHCIPIALVGVDFLAFYKIIIDVYNHKLHEQPALPPLNHDVEFPKLVAAAPTSITEEKVSDVSYDFLQREFSEVFDIQNYHKPSLHDTIHHIVTKGLPVHWRVRHLSPEHLMILR